MKKIISMMAFAAVAAGCSNMPSQLAAPVDPSAYCFSSLSRNPLLDVLIPKIGAVTTPNAATIEQLSNAARPTAEEKETLAFWATERQRCFDSGRDYRAQRTAPIYALALEQHHTLFLDNLSQLYAGNIGYGDFIKRRQSIALEAQSRFLSLPTNFQSNKNTNVITP